MRRLQDAAEPHAPGRRWINAAKARYYQVELVQDLLGDWTLVQFWGGLGSRLGGQRIVYVATYEAGLERMVTIGKQRERRGYVERPEAQFQARRPRIGER